jgi:hypothetical protein
MENYYTSKQREQNNSGSRNQKANAKKIHGTFLNL